MATRNQNILSLSGASSLLLLLVLLLVNVAASRSRVRVDLTEEGLFTLARGSRQILVGLGDPATIKVFWHNVPEAAEGQRRDIEALLDEMEAVAGSRLNVRWIDLDSEDGQREAEDAGIQKVAVTAAREGEITAKDSYQSLLIEVGDKKETIADLLNQGAQLEYEIVSRLHRMTHETPVVGLVAPQPAYNPFSGGAPSGRFSVIQSQVLPDRYGDSFRSSVKLDEPVAPDVRVLLVVAPEKLTDEQVYHLDQYLVGGGRVILLLDPIHADVGRPPNSEAVKSGLDDWLGHLGVTVESGVVGDYQWFLQRIQVRQTARGPLGQLIDYPYWPLLRQQDLDADNPAIRDFDGVPLFWPQALSLDMEKQTAAKREATILATTSEGGYRRPDLIGLDQPRDHVTRDDLAKIPVMALLQGPMTSFWKGRPTPMEAAAKKKAEDEAKKKEEAEGSEEGGTSAGPADETGEGGDEKPPVPGAESPSEEAGEEEGAKAPPDDPPPADEDAKKDDETSPGDAPADQGDADEGTAGDEGDGDAEAASEEPAGPPRVDDGEGMLVVATDAELVADTPLLIGRQLRGLGMGAAYQGGFPFVVNLVEWMSGSDELLSLRARTAKPRQIEDVEPSKQHLLTWLNILGIPLLVLFAGIVVWLVRRFQR